MGNRRGAGACDPRYAANSVHGVGGHVAFGCAGQSHDRAGAPIFSIPTPAFQVFVTGDEPTDPRLIFPSLPSPRWKVPALASRRNPFAAHRPRACASTYDTC